MLLGVLLYRSDGNSSPRIVRTRLLRFLPKTAVRSHPSRWRDSTAVLEQSRSGWGVYVTIRVQPRRPARVIELLSPEDERTGRTNRSADVGR